MIRSGISKQIIIISVLPALIVATLLSTHFVWDQYDYLSKSLDRNGRLIAKQLSPAAEYAVYSGNTEFITPLVNTIIKNNSVLRIQILDKDKNSILDAKNPEYKKPEKTPLNRKLLADIFNIQAQQLVFIEPIIAEQINIIDENDVEKQQTVEHKLKNTADNQIGKVIITFTTKFTSDEQIKQIQHGILITISVILLTTLIVIRLSRTITRPIKSLTQTVRSIASGNLDAHVELNSSGELGILESCINQMKSELKASQTNLETQIDTSTKELQQTLEELEIRNAELDITRSKAIHASNAKSEFLANMSHEIRTPLSGIIGFTELLKATSLSSQQKDYAGTIEKSSKSLLLIINDILDLSKIESGKTVITNTEFNIIDIIEDIINLLSPTALDKNIELFYRVEKNIPNIINSDPFHIHQVLTNLIGNAIKFTEQGYVYLQVTAGEIINHVDTVYEPENSVEKTELHLNFSISDSGIGMSNSDKQKLFKAFTQADTSITRRFGGTGLGLVISKKLTLLMSGKMGFDSTEGKGSTFWFTIPVFSSIAIPLAAGVKKSGEFSTELVNKKIAFVSNHFIAEQAFNTLFTNAQCTVNNYSFDDLIKPDNNVEKNNDAIVLFLSRKEINKENTKKEINKLAFSKPTLLIASTRSHIKLKNLQQHIFDAAVFSSEKTGHIKQKLINIINKSPAELHIENININITESSDWSSINVMVVDDNEVNLRLAEIILRKHKTRVTTAISGEQALDYVCTHSFDIIFMDLHMPSMDGYVTTKKIREITPRKQAVIIALTANALPQEKEKVIKYGMNGILIKPVSDDMFKKTINQWLLKNPKSSVINTSGFNDLNLVNIPTNDANEKDPELKKNIFSINLAKKFTGENKELAYELFSMLRAELNDYKKSISIAIKNNDRQKLYEQVHKLHGASQCCGTEELKNTSSHIENLINQNVNFDIEKETRTLLIAIKNVMDYKITEASPMSDESLN